MALDNLIPFHPFDDWPVDHARRYRAYDGQPSDEVLVEEWARRAAELTMGILRNGDVLTSGFTLHGC